MDLMRRTESVTQGDMTWIKNWSEIVSFNLTATVRMTDFVLATHFPDYFLLPGLLLGKYTSGANDGYFGPYTPGASDGRQTAVAAIYSGFQVKRDASGTADAAEIAGAVVPLLAPAQVYVSKLPGTLTSAPAAHPIVTADLPTGWLDLDDFYA